MPSSPAARAATPRQARTLDWRDADPSRRRRPDRRRKHRRRGVAASRSRSRAATGATTANIAGCGACRSRASAPDGELVGFIGVGTDITLAKEAELELRRQVEEQTARARASRGAVPRGVRSGARGDGAARARTAPCSRSTTSGEMWRHPNPRRRDRRRNVGRADAARLSRSISR